ncbi:MAG: coproporphyrinogen III oxidase, partial [Oscillatoriales cyanobacterium SM2_2_1]|nr:coproporphyrinogen III oxidase [Oscillatoriales cyanobacterium SM2_2_1]
MTADALYLHIPFCRRKCFYCDFAITTAPEPWRSRYVDLLCQELILTARTHPPT